MAERRGTELAAVDGPLRRIVKDQVVRAGWQSGTDLEDVAARFLISVRWTPDQVKQQHRVGRFKLDFAWPALKVALEVDGWHHRSPEGAAKDAARDSWLRSQGWVVFRVDAHHGEEALKDQVARVSGMIRAEMTR